MRAGYAFMFIGVLAAVLGRNPDAYMMGILMGVTGLILLRVKGV